MGRRAGGKPLDCTTINPVPAPMRERDKRQPQTIPEHATSASATKQPPDNYPLRGRKEPQAGSAATATSNAHARPARSSRGPDPDFHIRTRILATTDTQFRDWRGSFGKNPVGTRAYRRRKAETLRRRVAGHRP